MAKNEIRHLADRVNGILTNTFYYKIVSLLLLTTVSTPFFGGYSYRLMYISLLWGAYICVADLFGEKRMFRSKRMLWLIGFLISMMISAVVNIGAGGLKENITTWIYMAIQFLVLYPQPRETSRKRIYYEMSVLNYIFIGFTLVCSLASVVMFVLQYVTVFNIDGHNYVIGWYGGRLFGAYSNPCLMLSCLGIALCLVQYVVDKTRNIRMSGAYHAVMLGSIAVNLISASLEYSKGSLICLAVFMVLFFGLLVYRRVVTRDMGIVPSAAIGVASGAAPSALLAGLVWVIRKVMQRVPALLSVKSSEIGAISEEDIVNINRDIPASYGVLTGRPQIWKAGIESFLEKPLFGWSAAYHPDSPLGEAPLGHFHNLIVHTLACSGVVGSFCIFGFLGLTAVWYIAGTLRKSALGDECAEIRIALLALFAMILVNSMAEVLVLYLVRIAAFVFWIMLGYAVALGGESDFRSDRLLCKVADRLDSIKK